MDRVNNKKRITATVLLSALFAGLIFIVLSVINNIAPFGDSSILRNDAVAQYAPFLANYVERIKSGASILYSWNNGGGANQFALICYYLLSPFNLIALPFDIENIDIAFYLIIFVKTLCIAASSNYYFQKKSKDSDIVSVVFSLIYTFGGFYISFYYNTMWLDALIMLPLIALGIENIVNGKKASLYFLSLAYAIFVNFYIGYMICIFAVLYFIYLIFSKDITAKGEKEEDEAPIMQVMCKFGFSSLFAGLICAVIILPVIFALNSVSDRSAFNETESFFNFFDFLSYNLSGVITGQIEKTSETAPYVMSSILTFLTVPTFFLLKNVKPNKKVATAVILAVFYFSFAMPKMNYFWHGFSAPNFLPYRFSFIYLFFILTLAFDVVKNIKNLPAWSFAISGVLIVTALVYTKYSQFASHFSTKTVVVSAVAAALYLVVLLLYKYEKLSRKLVKASLLCVLAAELVISNYQNMLVTKRSSEVFPLKEDVNLAKEKMMAAPNSLNRFDIIDNSFKIKTFPAAYTYNGVSVFSSLSDTEYAITQRTLGNLGNYQNSFKYVAQTPIYNAFMSMGYVYDTVNSIDEGNPFYEEVATASKGKIYRVKYTLPIGYCVNEKIEKWDSYNYLPVSVQGLLWSYSLDSDNILLNACKTDNIVYNNCYAVDYKEISNYVGENVDKGTPQQNEAEHDHVHDHSNEEEEVAADEKPENSVDVTLSAETLPEMLNLIGDIYAFKATDDNFSVSFEYTAKEDGEAFALANSGCMQTLTVIHENGTKKDIDISDRHISDLGYFVKGEKYTLVVSNPDRPLSEFDEEYPLTDSIQMSVASINEEKFKEGYNKILENGTLDVKEFDDTYIYGTVKAKSDCVMMMPIPYDKGWTVYIDGEPVELKEHHSHIMMFDMPQGEHEVEMSYFPLGLKEGLFVSAASILGIVMVLLLSKVHKMKKQFIEEEEKKESEKKDNE